MKSGIQTTEFYVSILGLIFTAVAPLLPHSTEVVNAVSAVAAALVAFGYTWARAFVKTKTA